MKILHCDCDNYPSSALEKLRALGALYCQKPSSKTELVTLVEDADALVVRMDTAVDRGVLDAAPRLKVVASATTGVNHLNIAAMEERGIAVLTLRGETRFLETIPSTAELTFGLLLALFRKIPAAFNAAKNGEWKPTAFQGGELAGKTIGLVGYGRIGRMVARYACVFGMTVMAYDPHVATEAFERDGVRSVAFGDLLRESDVVSMHASHTPETDCMMDREAFRLMRAGSFFLNTARGEIVDEGAMLEALESGRLAGAAIDVLASENDAMHNLRQHPLLRYARTHQNFIVTPHIAGMAIESVHKTSAFIAEKVIRYAKAHGLQ